MINKVKLKAVLRLGGRNLLRYLFYKLGIITGINSVKRLKCEVTHGFFFKPYTGKIIDTSYQPELTYSVFGTGLSIEIDKLVWNKNYLTEQLIDCFDKPWYEISDFNSNLGDIKGIWEVSRFDWILNLAASSVSGNRAALELLNNSLHNWIEVNKPYLGPNWKCGQESSIRVMNLAMAATLLSQTIDVEDSLLKLVECHLERIAPTISYAVSQDNNHGTSEAAALFIGGSWLRINGYPKGVKWERLGRKWLENRIQHLIAPDGSFSQYSTNYHRVVLDTLSMVEIWRRELSLNEFSLNYTKRVSAATNWLYQLIQPISGDVPNLGANDGAHLLQWFNLKYRDFRPTVQLASILFIGKSAFSAPGDYDIPLTYLKLTKPLLSLDKQSSFHFPDGGYFGLYVKGENAFAFMNYPRYQFRPSQCDPLHVDFWLDGVNILRDGGTFSYNAGQEYIDYYGGVASHNTIQFDDSEPMPRCSRFLLGEWLSTDNVFFDNKKNIAQAAYCDYRGNYHCRSVQLANKTLIIKDVVSGFKCKAVLRWRLSPGDWTIVDGGVTNGQHSIKISSSVEIKKMELTKGRESLYYYNEIEIPVLEIEFTEFGEIITIYEY